MSKSQDPNTSAEDAQNSRPGIPDEPTSQGRPARRGPSAWMVFFVVVAVVALAVASGVAQRIVGLPREHTAVAIVKEYLQALAEGRGADAASYLDVSDHERRDLLTDEVLQDSLTRAPITDININLDELQHTSAKVDVTYQIGGELAVDTYVVDIDRGKIADSALGELSFVGTGELPVTVNGVAAESTVRYQIFPGSYVLSPASEYVTFTQTTAHLNKSNRSIQPMLTATPTEAGIAMFREKVRPEAEACLASKQIEAGCGLTKRSPLPEDSQPIEGTITRVMYQDGTEQLQNLEPYVEGPLLGIPAMRMPSVDLQAECVDGAGSKPCVIGSAHFDGVFIDLRDPDLAVTWNP